MNTFCCDERRRAEVKDGPVNGIDFLEVLDHDALDPADRQRILLVHFVNPLVAPHLTADNVRIEGGERIDKITVVAVTPGTGTSDRVLTLEVDSPGDFSTYTLRLVKDAKDLKSTEPPDGIDPALSAIVFSFKVECSSDFDCQPRPACPPKPRLEPEIDYLAKDYASFRRLLLDRLALLMPDWRERNPADMGIALIELLSYVGDYLSYQQDAVATEAFLETARRRTSVRRHAVLVDYLMHDGSNARTWVQFQVGADVERLQKSNPVPVPLHSPLSTRLPSLPARIVTLPDTLMPGQVVFETMQEVNVLYAAHNEIRFFNWSDERCCLPAGATRAFLEDDPAARLRLCVGDVLIFEEKRGAHTGSEADADPTRRFAVRLTHVNPEAQPVPDDGVEVQRTAGTLRTDPVTGQAYVEIAWSQEDALPFPFCVSARADEAHGGMSFADASVARGNIVLADHGRTGKDEPLGLVPPARRFQPASRDANRCEERPAQPIPARYRPILRNSPLTQAARYDPTASASAALHWARKDVVPAITLTGVRDGTPRPWSARRDLLSSKKSDTHFVVEVEANEAQLRFGDDRLGQRPEPGTAFTAQYRVGNGTAGNIGADALFHIRLATDLPGVKVRNPLPAWGGEDPESLEDVRRRAPSVFRTLERAVTADDYAEVAQRDPLVQRAAATFRWTGSWQTVFLTVDQLGGLPVDAAFKKKTRTRIERYRMAGQDLEIDAPRLIAMEIDMHVCVRPDYFRSHVKQALLDLFSNRVLPDGSLGLFHPDRFTFGQTVYLSALIAAAQSVAGVASVDITTFQRLEKPETSGLDDGQLTFFRLEIPRLENDRNFPERGVFRLDVGGGKMNALDPTLQNLDDCGCCAGVTAETPSDLTNRPGLSAIAYRIGTHSRFLDSMLAELSAGRHTELAGLKTRDRDDFAIALLDGWATIADVLTFYQERIANESFLRTATERLSLLNLARLIGYELAPGVAANALLAFTLEEAKGSPRRTDIDIGVKVQSIPGPGDTAQTFETVEQFEARVEWNALKPRTAMPPVIDKSTTFLYLQGVTTQLQPGDAILIVGEERLLAADNERWDFRLLETVTPDADRDLTRITWNEPLGDQFTQPASKSIRLYALRQRAALFGHNAIDPRVLRLTFTQMGQLLNTSHTEWKDYRLGEVIDLDAPYPKIIKDSWVVLATTVPANQTELYQVQEISFPSRRAFGLSGKVTRIVPSGESLGDFPLLETIVYGQSEELTIAPTPLTDPVWDSTIVLDRVAADVPARRTVAVFGKRAKVRINPTGHDLPAVDADGNSLGYLRRGDLLFVLEPTVDMAGTPPNKTWHLENSDGVSLFATASDDQLSLVAPTREDARIMELALVTEIDSTITGHTTLVLAEPLRHAYDRDSVTINANVIAATHGETVQEILGSATGRPYQRFTLRQSPLTSVSAANARGIESTLQLRVNDVLWHEVPTLYGLGPRDRDYITRTDDDVKTTALFGDGASGACPPTGQDNVRAVYRKGIGKDGLVKAGQLSLLLTRPLGVKEVINPEEATGAKDRETLEDARRNAPLTVLTLDRAVSLRDYEDFASAFAGIGKALATWTWQRGERGVFLTVAGQDGADVLPTGKTYQNLLTALKKAGDPEVPLQLATYRRAYFRLTAKLKINPDYLADKVRAAVEKALRDRFAFAARAFGQPVMRSEVIAVIQAVEGVIAVDVDTFHRTDPTPQLSPGRLLAEMPVAKAGSDALAAELLLLDKAPLDAFGTMP